MSNTPNAATAAKEIDPASLDQVVGGASSVVMHDARKQEQSDKLQAEQLRK